MKPKIKRISSIIVVALLLIAGTVLGWYFGPRPVPPAPPEVVESAETVEVYFAKPDGIYRVSADQPEEQLVLAVEWNFANPVLLAAGAKREYLIYLTYTEKKYDWGSQVIPAELHQYSLIDGSDVVISPAGLPPGKATTDQIIVSPDGTKLAFVINGQPIDEGYKQTLHLWDVDQKKEIKSWEKPGKSFLFLRLSRWLNNLNVLIGYFYEGGTECRFSVAADKLPTSENCKGFGIRGMGDSEGLFGEKSGQLFGIADDGEADSGQPRQQGIFSRQEGNAEKEFFVSGLIAEAVLSSDRIYYLLSNQGGGSRAQELYLTNLDGTTTRKLSSNAGSTGVKQKLQVTPSERYVAYQQYFPSDVGESLASNFSATSIWLYDSVLDKLFQVVNGGRSPAVIHRQ